ncbi:MAG: transposase [Saccharofermentans sp.]|nr:transposase [Saccharofermentans sp.]
MRYSKEFKLKCVKLYRQGKYPKTPDNISSKRFRNEIREWVREADSCGLESLERKSQNKKWSLEEKIALVQEVLNGQSCLSVAINNGISSGMLYSWIRKYRLYGNEGLTRKPGRRPKESVVSQNKEIAPLNESEREELIRLRAETARMRTEIAAIKKEIALREEQEKARLKAKKQRLSKNSKTSDTN